MGRRWSSLGSAPTPIAARPNSSFLNSCAARHISSATASCHITGRGVMMQIGGLVQSGRERTLEGVGTTPHLPLPQRKLLQVLLLWALLRAQTPYQSERFRDCRIKHTRVT